MLSVIELACVLLSISPLLGYISFMATSHEKGSEMETLQVWFTPSAKSLLEKMPSAHYCYSGVPCRLRFNAFTCTSSLIHFVHAIELDLHHDGHGWSGYEVLMIRPNDVCQLCYFPAKGALISPSPNALLWDKGRRSTEFQLFPSSSCSNYYFADERVKGSTS